ncbi:gas vesicle protein GvpN [Leptolyngbya sp. FACHB-261]|uniref:gas vesicle protein GvpN n=1 Tax=Leptolyngbya sp. FACHB-261 TaxID=2692806 RepID=UPI0016882D67|nr:gas vesicle protein GvpN [Leptolyngbya sp. FACHB-261]MBD2103908.1 gas vesicle protein GvpN [Leptolyngbya sp. FACHB-261]
MATVLQARPRQFVNTAFTDSICRRALRYLQSGFAVHLRGPAGTGKTTIAMHLAGLMGRPMMLLYGDDDLNSSDLIGGQSGYTRKRVVDNYIHSVVKVEDDMRHKWVDSRLTLAAREGFTLVYDEFNRSRPEANNVLLSVLEERLLVLPPNSNQSEYVRVDQNFRAIFTSNPEDYCGAHKTQDALLDRMITIDIGLPDLDTERAILVTRVGLTTTEALKIAHLIRAYRQKFDGVKAGAGQSQPSSLRTCLMIGRIAKEHEIIISGKNDDFRHLCEDVLLSRYSLGNFEDAKEVLSNLLDQLP